MSTPTFTNPPRKRVTHPRTRHYATLGKNGWSVSWLGGRDDLSLGEVGSAFEFAGHAQGYKLGETPAAVSERLADLAYELAVDVELGIKLVKAASR